MDREVHRAHAMSDSRRCTFRWHRAALGFLLFTSAACSTGDAAAPRIGPGAQETDDAPGGGASPGLENDVGTVTIRRLNGTEFDNNARDLVGTTKHYSSAFPPDDGAEGFTNVADALTMSPLLFEG